MVPTPKMEELQPAWSFVVLTFLEDKVFLLGTDYGLVYTEPLEAGWIGADGSAAKDAEATAIVRALEWTLGNGLEKSHVFAYDADAVGGAVAGRYSVQEDDKLIRVARAMAKALEAFLPHQSISWQHVKGHSGVLGNEIADAVAKWAYRNQYECGIKRPDYTPVVCGPTMAIEHAWIFFQSQNEEPSLPSWDNQMLSVPPIEREQGIEGRLPLAFRRPSDEKFVLKPLVLSAITFNVNTLLPRAGNVMVSFLREQLSSHGFYITFLQETRARVNNVVRSATHARIVSAARAGHQFELFDLTKLIVLHASPEVLAVKVRFRGVDVLLASIHAPHSSADHSTLESFWTELSAQVREFSKNVAFYILGIDANAHFDSDCEGIIGTAGLEPRSNAAASLFQNFLVEIEGYLPSTFDHIHSGQHWTWQSHANGYQSRCDYLVLPQSLQTSEVHTYPIHTLETAQVRSDHTPLAIELTVSKARRIFKASQKHFDRHKLQASTPQQLDQILADIRTPPWPCDIERHVAVLSDQIVSRLVKAFPPDKDKPRRSYISDAAWLLRKDRLMIRHGMQSIREQCRVLALQTIWESWRSWRQCDAEWWPKKLLIRTLVLLSRFREAQLQSAELTKTLKKQLRRDRTDFLEDLARRMPHMKQQDFFKRSEGRVFVTPRNHQIFNRCPWCVTIKVKSSRTLTSSRISGGSILLVKKMVCRPRWKSCLLDVTSLTRERKSSPPGVTCPRSSRLRDSSEGQKRTEHTSLTESLETFCIWRLPLWPLCISRLF